MTARFTPEELAVIERFTEEGAFLSAEKLGLLSRKTWAIVSSSVEEVPVVQALSLFEADPDPHYGVHLKSKSLLPAQLMVFFKEPSIHKLSAAVAAQSAGLRALPEPAKAVMREVSNIIGQAVLKSIADSLKISLILSSPELHLGSKSGIFAEAFGKLDGMQDTVVLIRLDMSSAELVAECSLALLLQVSAMRDLLKKFADA